jgi:DNA-binding XRE family transcriptional regulator
MLARRWGMTRTRGISAMGAIGSSAREHLRELRERDPELQAEYDRLGPRFDLVRQLIRARKAAKLTQRELGERVGVSKNVITRMESGEHTPRLETAQEVASALGYRLEVRLVKERRKASTR